MADHTYGPSNSNNQATTGTTCTEHAPDWFVAIFTALLVFVTYRLVQSTNKLWEAGERQIIVAQKAADAATASAEFIPRVERAYLTGGGDVELNQRGGNQSFA